MPIWKHGFSTGVDIVMNGLRGSYAQAQERSQTVCHPEGAALTIKPEREF
jgi:hypothetical protein